MKHLSITLIAISLITIQSALSQSISTKKSNSNSVSKVVIPEIKNIRVDTALKLETNQNPYISRVSELPDEYESDEAYSEEETDEEGEATGGGYLSPEEINTAELTIDSAWFKMADYYTVWDSKKVNPYGIDGKLFKDTLKIVLFDSITKWSSPITHTAITSNFGFRKYRWHYGTDLKLNIGDSVNAVFDGIVRMAKFDRRGYGNYVLIRHNNGLETLYGHLSKTNVVVGQVVKAGDVIGLGGNTGRSSGPHLHFEVRYQGNAIDPYTLFNFEQDSLFTANEFTLTPSHFKYLSEAKAKRSVAAGRYHKVRRGDTLSGISRKYGVPTARLCKINRISKRTPLKVGRRLRVR
jgi:murein DD-endopeptidase MepM/ murein hydrolase activator NlpD